MSNIILLGFMMIFFHILGDFYLPSNMRELKTKIWWDLHEPQEMYKADYKMMNIIHSFFVSMMMHIPVFVCLYLKGNIHCLNSRLIRLALIATVAFNTVSHYDTDMKMLNYGKLNLWQEQLSHYILIFSYAWIYYVIFKFV